MSMSDRDGVIWFDGKMVPWRDANIHVLTHSLHYGMGIFEGIRAYKTENGTAVFRLAEHVKRLFNGLKIFQMKIDYSEEQIAQAILQVVRDNKLASCYIRPIIFIGSEKLGISPTAIKCIRLLPGNGAPTLVKMASIRGFGSKPHPLPATS